MFPVEAPVCGEADHRDWNWGPSRCEEMDGGAEPDWFRTGGSGFFWGGGGVTEAAADAAVSVPQLQPPWRTSSCVHTVSLSTRTGLPPSATTAARCCGGSSARASSVKVRRCLVLLMDVSSHPASCCVLSRLRAELSQALRLQDPQQLQRREEAPLVQRLPDGGAAELWPPALS